jgi:hypothetical protein
VVTVLVGGKEGTEEDAGLDVEALRARTERAGDKRDEDERPGRMERAAAGMGARIMINSNGVCLKRIRRRR